MSKKHIFLDSKVLTIIIGCAVTLVILLFAILNLIYSDQIFPNTYVSNIYLGGLNRADAEKKLKDNFRLSDKLILSINGKDNTISTSEIVNSINYSNSVKRVYSYSHTNNLFFDFVTRLKLFFKPVNLAVDSEIDEDKLLETLLIAFNTNELKPVYPSASIVNNEVIINSGKDGVDINFDKVRSDIGENISFNKNQKIVIEMKSIKSSISGKDIQLFKSKAEKIAGKKIILKSDEKDIELDDKTILSYISPLDFYNDKIEDQIKKISEDLNRNPQDSIFVIANEKVTEFAPSKNGIVVDEKALTLKIKEATSRLINGNDSEVVEEIPVITTKPKINNEDVNDLGIKSLIGTGFSNFKGSIPNRIHNVNLAQSRFKGVLIPPDTVVSFNEVLGDVSSYTGYKSAYVIKDGKTVLGDGGGVCQVSTTLFRAVLNAGLPVTERRAHAYRVGYYEQGFGPGLDATVYSPTTDFKFKNDTPAYILLQPTIDLNNLTLKFDIYGTDDGRISNVTKPVVSSSIAPAEDLYVDDPTLPAGQIKQIEHKAYGAKVTFEYKVTRNGEELINHKFVSNYRPWQAVFLRGVQ